MSGSWALEAIERAAMERAERALASAGPRSFSWMGVSGERLTWLIHDYERRTGKRAAEINPQAVEQH